MTYLDQWKALSSRIRGLMEAGHLHAQYLAVRSSDSYDRAKWLREQGERILAALRAFRDSFHQMLPPPAVTTIDDFVARAGTLISDTTGTPDSLQERVWATLVFLVAFETEMSFLLSDVEESIRSRSERAFSHLQRSIVVDEGLWAKWQKAFEHGEVACEKLGAVHLLLHGVWAFKLDAAGARTDLVFQEPGGDFIAAQRYADGFVLTEWKKAANDSESGQRFEEAAYRRAAIRKARSEQPNSPDIDTRSLSLAGRWRSRMICGRAESCIDTSTWRWLHGPLRERESHRQ